MSTKKYLDLNGLSRVWDKAENKYSKKILSISSAYGVSSSSSTLPTRWTLPAEYQEIEYLQSTATELIDTGVDAFDVRKIECKFATMSKGSSQYITGTRSTNSNTILFAIDGPALNKKFSGVYNGNILMTSDIDRENGVIVNAILEISDAVEGKRTMTFKCNDGTYDETKTQSNVNDVEITGYTVGIFGWNSNNKTAIRLYREKIYTDSGLVRDYVPCLNKTTGKYGLYDMVNNQFYTSTVDFTLYGSNATYVPQMTETSPYLWQQNIITYTDGTTQSTTPYVIENKCEGGSSGGGSLDAYIDLTSEASFPVISGTANVATLEAIVSNYEESHFLPPHIVLNMGGEQESFIVLSTQSSNSNKVIQFVLAANETSQNVTSLNFNSFAFAYRNDTWQFQALTSYDLNNFIDVTTANSLYALKTLYGDTTINIGRATSTTAGTKSVAIGHQTEASGFYTFAEGASTIASGDIAHAEGSSTTASGDIAHAEGSSTIAQRKSQHVEGEFNIADTQGNSTVNRGQYVHIVGNGNSNNARSNAHTLDWSGNAWYSGDVYVGSTSGTNKDAGSKKLATEDYVDSLVVEGAKKVMLYDGKSNNAAILTGVTQELTDSIFNYDLIIVGFNVLVGSTRVMELTMPVYPKSGLVVFCDSTGTGATGAYHIVNANTAFATGNAYRVMWGFTDSTHIRNIISNQVGWASPGICYVVGYKFSTLPNNYATETYVDNAIASAVTSAIGGSY